MEKYVAKNSHKTQKKIHHITIASHITYSKAGSNPKQITN